MWYEYLTDEYLGTLAVTLASDYTYVTAVAMLALGALVKSTKTKIDDRLYNAAARKLGIKELK